MKGGIGYETWDSQALNDTDETSIDVPVSKNWYKTVSNLYENSYINNFV